MVIGWESSTISSIEVLRGISTLVKVDLGVVVGIERPEKSIPWALLVFFLLALVL